MPFIRHARVTTAVLAVLLLLAVTHRSAAQDLLAGNAEVEARYLFFLSEFIQWPADKESSLGRPFTVGFVGRSRVEEFFNEANVGHAGGRRFEVLRVNTLADIRRCNILFFDGPDFSRVAPLLKEARKRNVLSVGESETFIKQGGMINFASYGGRVRPQVNLDAVRKARLRPDSRLLRSADIVNSNGELVQNPGQ